MMSTGWSSLVAALCPGRMAASQAINGLSATTTRSDCQVGIMKRVMNGGAGLTYLLRDKRPPPGLASMMVSDRMKMAATASEATARIRL